MANKNFIRFCAVGIINSVVDISIFVSLHSAGVNIILANICSTSAALVVSLLLNYNYTFRGRTLSRRAIGIYFLVTLAGIWLLQPLVITSVLALNDQLHFTNLLVNHYGHAKQLNSLIAKLASLAVSLVWNYAWYSRVVFKNSHS